jgi:superfamily I DNA/RNA helicase
MMSEDMLTSIISRLEDVNDYETDHITLYIFLDPYQLLPVKGKQIQTDPLFTKNLTTQHRSESPDVVNLFTKFVNYLEGTNKVDLSTPESSNVILTDNVKDFRKGDRLLAYTNNAVGFYNKLIAQQFGITSYEGQTVQLGNIADTFLVQDIVEPSIGQLLNYYESGKLVLQNSQINKLYLQENLQALLDNENITFIKAVNKIIPVVEGVGNANIVRQNAKLAAVDNKRNFKEVYALGRAFTMDYTFASTIHKAQGSEFNRVWIDKADIQKSIFGGSYVNYARLMYVAISRARQTIFILG